ncbi:hypothetical protein H0H92_007462 [Tricholoma furcatifolium]|nr:hypothetical protein H0H92_007462 [Tricholoma furcatifolium]
MQSHATRSVLPLKDIARCDSSLSQSTDLMTWTRQNDALTPIAGTNISSSNVVERPKGNIKELFSPYYGAAMVGVATASTPCGPYSYRGSFKPLGADSRDESLFQDDDGMFNRCYRCEMLNHFGDREAAQTTYLLYASDNNQNFKISVLDSNYYEVVSEVSVFTGATLEAPGIIKRDGWYYLFASHTSGWAPNPNKFFNATSLAGPWSSQADIAPEDTSTYTSQNAYDLYINDGLSIYMGDRWQSDLLGSSTYIWFPLSWSTGVPQILQADVWSVDVSSGTYNVASGVSYEAESGTLSGSAVILTNSVYSGGEAVGYLG